MIKEYGTDLVYKVYVELKYDNIINAPTADRNGVLFKVKRTIMIIYLTKDYKYNFDKYGTGGHYKPELMDKETSYYEAEK
jgi:hypothetical protein